MSKSLNIVFFGTPDFAMPVLEALIKEGYNVSRFQPRTLKDEQVFEEFKNLKPDICIIAAYGKILPQKYIDIPKYGFINIHPSILSKYRGPSPIQTAILNGDKETGVSIMLIDSEVDHGPILAEEKYELDAKYFSETAHDLFKIGADLILDTIPRYINGEIKPKEQDHTKATFTKMFDRKDGRINWQEPASKIYDRIRALGAEPGTWTTWKGKALNIFGVEILNKESDAPGLVEKIDGNVAVITKKCYLILKSIQLEGGKIMDAKSFVNGHPDFLNSKLD